MKNQQNKFKYALPRDIHALFVYLATNKSVYFAPLNRMMPTAFFKGYIWNMAIVRHFDKDSFFLREKRVPGKRIKETLKDIPVPV